MGNQSSMQFGGHLDIIVHSSRNLMQPNNFELGELIIILCGSRPCYRVIVYALGVGRNGYNLVV